MQNSLIITTDTESQLVSASVTQKHPRLFFLSEEAELQLEFVLKLSVVRVLCDGDNKRNSIFFGLCFSFVHLQGQMRRWKSVFIIYSTDKLCLAQLSTTTGSRGTTVRFHSKRNENGCVGILTCCRNIDELVKCSRDQDETRRPTMRPGLLRGQHLTC